MIYLAARAHRDSFTSRLYIGEVLGVFATEADALSACTQHTDCYMALELGTKYEPIRPGFRLWEPTADDVQIQWPVPHFRET